MIIYKQQFLYSDWLRTCQLIPNQWNFTSTTLNHIRFDFITISKITKEIFAKICWQLKTPTRTWKCTRCIMQMSYLYASEFPFKNICKIAQHTDTIRKQCLAKEYWRVLVVDKSTDHDETYFDFYVFMFLRRYQRQRKCFLSKRELKKALRDTLTRAAWLGSVIFYWFVLSMRMQVILAPVVRKVDNAIHRINHYPADSVVCFVNTYPLDSDLSGG